jgi:hypothetical protein
MTSKAVFFASVMLRGVRCVQFLQVTKNTTMRRSLNSFHVSVRPCGLKKKSLFFQKESKKRVFTNRDKQQFCSEINNTLCIKQSIRPSYILERR